MNAITWTRLEGMVRKCVIATSKAGKEYATVVLPAENDGEFRIIFFGRDVDKCRVLADGDRVTVKAELVANRKETQNGGVFHELQLIGKQIEVTEAGKPKDETPEPPPTKESDLPF